MFSLKEAMLVKERSGGAIDAAIFYMDMRTFGKQFQRYREKAEKEHGVRFVRSRIHSVAPEPSDGSVWLDYAQIDGGMHSEPFDLVVLATGQRPPKGASQLAEAAGVELNSWGFCRTEEFSLSRTTRDGVLVSGSFSGLRDISESVIQAGSAALRASSILRSTGGGLAEAQSRETPIRDVSRELPEVAAAICTCNGALETAVDLGEVLEKLSHSDSVNRIFKIERLCTQEGWAELEDRIKTGEANRVLIGACQPCVYAGKLKELARSVGLNPGLMDGVDIITPTFSGRNSGESQVGLNVQAALLMGAARLKGINPVRSLSTEVVQKALIVGGGIAGMAAALAIAEQGLDVSLIERANELGGNLRSLHSALGGYKPRELLQKTIMNVEKHPRIHIYKEARVAHSSGQVGRFLTVIEKGDGTVETLEHGVTILATGGSEAQTLSFGHGKNEAIITQHKLEERLHTGDLKPAGLRSVVMIQCVDSRDENRRYCSRICCSSALKNALYLKEQNPEVDIYVLYRDIMAYGFLEAHYTKARKAGIVFIQYDLDGLPVVRTEGDTISVTVRDPVLGRDLLLEPDLLALSTGMVPGDQKNLSEIFGVEVDEDGFFREAESKWRPVDFLKSGVFMCGLAHSPRSIEESIASAEAAAQRALSIIGSERISSSSVVAEVRSSLCSLCERCIDACPYGARWRDEDEERIMVNELACQGCGSCAAACPNSASVLRGYSDQQMLAVIDAALEVC
jgi:heterodisulfide reductase subunit A